MSIAWRVRTAYIERHSPSGWKVRRIGDLVDLVNGYPFPSNTFGPSGEMPLVRIRELVTYVKDFSTYVSGYIPRECILEDGDIVIGMDGDFNVVRWVRGKAALNQRLCRLRPRAGVDIRFIGYALPSILGVINELTFSTTVKHLSSSDILAERLPLPTMDEQRRIADFLDAEMARIDRLAALQHSVLAKLDQRDRAVRDSLIDRLADKVGELPLRRYSTRIEQGSSPLCENHPREPGEWGVLKLSAVKQGRFSPDENKQLPGDVEPMPEYEVHDGDLLVTRANTPELVGDVAVASGAGQRLLLPDLIYRVGLERKISANFVAQVLLSSRVRSLIQATARGSSQSMVKLRGEDIREWPVPRADAEQQAEVVAAIDDQLRASDKLHAAINRQLTLLAERRQALITAAVTGGITV